MKAMQPGNRWTVGILMAACLGSHATVGLAQSIRYVDDDAATGGDGRSWAAAYRYLQDALTDASASKGVVKEIRVGPGTYRPDRGKDFTAGNRGATFKLLKGVSLKGGYAGLGAADPDANDPIAYSSVLSGDLLGNDGPDFTNYDDNSCHVVTGSGTDVTAVLDGFTITAGYANYYQSGYQQGAGLFNNAGSPTISRCTFRLCKSAGSNTTGGAVCNDYSSNPTIRECVFRDNSAEYMGGALSCLHNSVPTITDSLFLANRARIAGGLYLTAGANLTRCTIAANTGESPAAGVYCNSTGTQSLIDCRIVDNLGIGLGVSGANTVMSTNCLIARNQGGGIYVAGGTFTASGSAILCNSASIGAGAYLVGSSSVVRLNNCEIAGNTASTQCGGLYTSTADLIATNCRITGNTSAGEGGGIGCISAAARFANCVIADNRSARTGGGVWCSSASPVLTHCTLTGNTATSGAGALGGTGSPQVTNCILWGDGTPEIAFTSGTPAVTYCDVQAGFTGTGNIAGAPLFALPGYYRVLPGSPCIDAGTNTPAGGAPASDAEGRGRPQDGNADGSAVADIGAYEFTPAQPCIAVGPETVSVIAPVDQAAPDTTLQIRNCGTGTLTWTASSDMPWLTVDPASGSTDNDTQTVVLHCNRTGLAPGDYTATISLAASGAANAPKAVKYRLRVARTLHVPAEFATIQAAVDQASAGDLVLLADGTYTGTGNRGIYFRKKAITLRSEHGAEQCIIDCGGLSYTSAVNFRSGEGRDSVLEGVTLRNAVGQGGGVYCDSSSPTIRNCLFVDHRSTSTGSAFYARYGSPALSDCTFRNVAGPAAGGESCNLTMTRCRVTASGEGVRIDRGWEQTGTLNLTQSIVDSNKGCGVFCGGASMTVANCIISGNLCGISVQVSGQALLANNRVTGNSGTTDGAGLYVAQGDCTVVNCTFWGNTATVGGGGLHYEAGGITLISSVFWGNQAPNGPQIAVNYNGTALLASHCDVQGGRDGIWEGSSNLGLYWDDGNIDADPQFLDADGPDNIPGTLDDNLRLAAGSPCVNSGFISAAIPLVQDLDGNPRVVGSAVDMGAYEQAIAIAPAGPTVVPEGGTAFFAVALAAAPTGPVTVTARAVSGDPDISVQSGATLLFTPAGGEHPWNIPQMVTLAAAPDADASDGAATIEVIMSAGQRTELTARESDSGRPPALFVRADAPAGGDGYSWANAFNTIEDAVTQAVASDGVMTEIWVAAGTYRPRPPDGNAYLARQASFHLVSGIAIYGGFAGNESRREKRDPSAYASVLSGDLNGDDLPAFANRLDNSYHVVDGSAVDRTAVLDGFTISGGTGSTNAYADWFGGGHGHRRREPHDSQLRVYRQLRQERGRFVLHEQRRPSRRLRLLRQQGGARWRPVHCVRRTSRDRPLPIPRQLGPLWRRHVRREWDFRQQARVPPVPILRQQGDGPEGNRRRRGPLLQLLGMQCDRMHFRRQPGLLRWRDSQRVQRPHPGRLRAHRQPGDRRGWFIL